MAFFGFSMRVVRTERQNVRAASGASLLNRTRLRTLCFSNFPDAQ
jgi:hypothetical protein